MHFLSNPSFYAEGAFTPTLWAQTLPTGVTYATQTGRYTKTGRLVLVEGRLTLTSKGSGGVGQAGISGLPFSAALVGFSTEHRLNAGLTLPSGSTLATVILGTLLGFQSNGQSGASDIAWSSLADNLDLSFKALYSI